MTTDVLRKAAENLGFSDFGVCRADAPLHSDFYGRWLERGFAGEMDYLHKHAALKADVRNLMPECRSVIAVALDYNQPNPHESGNPKIARYALGRDYHKVLKAKLKTLQKQLATLCPDATFKACVDSTPVFEREFAHLAGLGWFGKNTCLIDSKRGSWFFIGLLLTSVEFPADEAAIGGCGTCKACIEACPTGAIVYHDDRWQVDSRSCISYLTIEKRTPIGPELAEKLEGWTFGCDICQEVCPFNQERESQPLRAAHSQEPDFLNKKKWPTLSRLAEISEEEWDVLTQGSPVRRAGYEGIKRNALLNLKMLKEKKI